MDNLFLFNNIRNEEIMDCVCKACAKKENYTKAIGLLVNFAMENGFTGNIWHNYLAYTLAYNENPFSIACENKGIVEGNLELVMHDIEFYMELFSLDIDSISLGFGKNLLDFQMERKNEEHDSFFVDIIKELALDLFNAKIEAQFYNALISFYQKYGVGDLGFHKAFRISDCGELITIKDVASVDFKDIIGYEWQKERLKANTMAFISGLNCNNVLLYGDSGTGKSSSIKAVLNQYYHQGLRMIEIYKHQMSEVANLIALLKKRHYFFIIYMDDLSFEEDEVSYKYLKSIIEGGLEATPKNILIYATSNRRHLIKESFQDNGEIGDDLHRNETKAEKLSLAARFGVSILYMSPNSQEYKNIVKELAKRHKIEISETELLSKATTWEIKYGSLSGRTASQFINYLASSEEEI